VSIKVYLVKCQFESLEKMSWGTTLHVPNGTEKVSDQMPCKCGGRNLPIYWKAEWCTEMEYNRKV